LGLNREAIIALNANQSCTPYDNNLLEPSSNCYSKPVSKVPRGIVGVIIPRNLEEKWPPTLIRIGPLQYGVFLLFLVVEGGGSTQPTTYREERYIVSITRSEARQQGMRRSHAAKAEQRTRSLNQGARAAV